MAQGTRGTVRTKLALMYIDAIMERLTPKSGKWGMTNMPVATGIAVLYELAFHIKWLYSESKAT